MFQFEGSKSIIEVRIGEDSPIENDSAKVEAQAFVNFLRLREVRNFNRIHRMMAQVSLPLEVRAWVWTLLGLQILKEGVDR